ncbi:MAG: DUF2975 domain-containing protein [Flavobacteriaceae bacterium]|nr:DUF2975 domain-containing protein [Flavobacteriaceae bacterium]
MRKLFILKTLVDIIWILSYPGILVVLIAVPFLFIYSDLSLIPIKLHNETLVITGFLSKLIISVILLSYLLIFYAVFLFRKALSMFIRKKTFDDTVITNFNKIGYLLSLFSIINIVGVFVLNLVSGKLEVSIGLMTAILCLGLFFMVLSEVFKIAKTAKQENELTI